MCSENVRFDSSTKHACTNQLIDLTWMFEHDSEKSNDAMFAGAEFEKKKTMGKRRYRTDLYSWRTTLVTVQVWLIEPQTSQQPQDRNSEVACTSSRIFRLGKFIQIYSVRHHSQKYPLLHHLKSLFWRIRWTIGEKKCQKSDKCLGNAKKTLFTWGQVVPKVERFGERVPLYAERLRVCQPKPIQV